MRSDIPIYAFTRHDATQRRVTLYRGVYPVDFDVTNPRPEQLYAAIFERLLQGRARRRGRPHHRHEGRVVRRLRRHQLDEDRQGPAPARMTRIARRLRRSTASRIPVALVLVALRRGLDGAAREPAAHRRRGDARGPFVAGHDRARCGGHSDDPRRIADRRRARNGLRPRAGPPLPDGPAAPHGRGRAGRAPRRGPAGRRPPHPPAPVPPPRAGIAGCARRARSRAVRSLRGRA